MPNPVLTHGSEDPLPITRGRLFDFPDDPIACMRKLRARHGNIAALEDQGQRVYFAFGPQFNHQILSDAAAFHSQFFAIRGSRNSAQRHLTSGMLSMNENTIKVKLFRARQKLVKAAQRLDRLPSALA